MHSPGHPPTPSTGSLPPLAPTPGEDKPVPMVSMAPLLAPVVLALAAVSTPVPVPAPPPRSWGSAQPVQSQPGAASALGLAGVLPPVPTRGTQESGRAGMSRVLRGGSGTARQAPRAGWRWPLDPVPVVLRPFERPTSTWGRGHRGVDLAAVEGQAVLAASAGVITHAGVIAGRPTVTVLHRGGIRTTYEPVLGSPRVGSRVAAGQRIGTLALTGSHCGAAACLHLGALRGSSYLDPLVLLRGGPVILLPLG